MSLLNLVIRLDDKVPFDPLLGCEGMSDPTGTARTVEAPPASVYEGLVEHRTPHM
jgi:hypothetical protein